MLRWSGGVWRRSSTVTTTMRARKTRKKTKVKVHHSRPADRGHPSRSAGTCGTTCEESQEGSREARHCRSRIPPFPKAGWDKDTEAFGHVLDYAAKEEVRQRIVFTARMSRGVPAKEVDYSCQKIFGDNLAAGHIQLEPAAGKPNKSSKDKSCVFFPSNSVWSTRRS